MLLAAAISFLQMPSGLTIAQEELPNVCTVQRGEPSESGLQPIHYLDENGEVFEPDLMPKYRMRDGSLPSKFDLREVEGKGLPAVRNQTGTGTCWAHAALGSIESGLIQNGSAQTDIDLSEAHLVWFSLGSTCQDPDDPLYGEGFSLKENAYLYGGSYQFAIETLASWSGYELEENTPAVNTRPSFDEADRYNSYGHVQNMEHYAIDDTTGIKTAIMNTGGLYADYYSDDSCYSQKKDYYCATSSEEINHAILVVGWDDDYSSANFVDTPPGDGAWLCRNSWGERWGNGGYFYISYYDATLTDFTAFHAEPVDNYDSIYQYDLNMAGWTSKSTSYNCAGANIFTAQKDENVTAVSFYTVEAETGYTVQVYKNVTGTNNPVSGTLAAEISGTELYAGYHTIDLPKAVSVRDGSRFSVVLSLDKSGIVFDEYSSQENVSFFGNARPTASGIYYGGWTQTLTTKDSSGNATPIQPNACIKAFTRTGTPINEEVFPDPVIRAYAESFDANGDGVLSSREIASHTATSVSFANTGLTNIQGLEIFRSIRRLDISNNPICAVDVSDLNLTSFTCKNCVLELGDSSCTDLQELGIDYQKMSNLKGADLGTRGLVPTDTTISYTYDCGSGFSAVFTLHADSIGHNYASPVSRDDDLHTLTCTDCGFSMTEAHQYSDWIDGKNGKHYKSCAGCSHTITESHSFTEWSDENGSIHTRTCEQCGAAEEAAHSVSAWTADDAETHSGTCADCGHALQEAHSYSKYIDLNAEQHFRKCTVCGLQETSDHRWSYVINKLRGNHSRVCKNCGYTETAKHTYGDYVQNKDGTHTHTCTACGHAETAEHTFGKYTAGTDGKHSHTCTVCGFTESVSHQFGTYKDNDDGTHTHVCKDCGFAESGDHTYGTKYTITKDSHAQTCTKCSHVETTAHTYGKCTDNGDGTHSHVCADCRYVETKAHSFGKYTAAHQKPCWAMSRSTACSMSRISSSCRNGCTARRPRASALLPWI